MVFLLRFLPWRFILGHFLKNKSQYYQEHSDDLSYKMLAYLKHKMYYVGLINKFNKWTFTGNVSRLYVSDYNDELVLQCYREFPINQISAHLALKPENRSTASKPEQYYSISSIPQ